MKINRREAVVGMTTALVSPVAASMGKQPAFANDVFVHGVASGDPAADSVVLWTRVSGQSGTVTVEWVVAADP
ncbi:MAG: PhoD-like phosphatase N-terminal domain-containing protein, partial [Pseudomonadota bacterium]